MNLNRNHLTILCCAICLAAVLGSEARASIDFGVDVGNYAIIYQGGSSGSQLSINNFGTVGNRNWVGDIGIAGQGQLAASGPGTLTGNVNFSASNSGQASISNTTINGTVNYGVTSVQTTMNALNTLSTSLGSSASLGAALVINTNSDQTVQVSSGNLVGGNRLFDVTSLSTGNGQNLFIQGNAGQNVVFDLNFSGGAMFSGNIILTDSAGRSYGQTGYNGITPDQVLFNVYNGNTLQANNNGNDAHPDNIMEGLFLDPNGSVSFVNTRMIGRIFGGDSTNMQIVSGDTITVPGPVPPPPPTVPEPMGIAVWLGLSGMAAGASAWRSKRRPASRRWSDQDRAAIFAAVDGKARR